MNACMLNMRLRLALLLLLTLLISGCIKGTAEVEDWVAREKSQPGAPIPALPVLKTFETFEYHDQGERDPFAPSLSEKKDDAVSEGAVPDPHSKEKLEDFPLDSLKMVGTLGAGATMEGLIKDPDGTVNRVHLRNYLGQNNGKITAINANRIDLVELITNGNGGWMERQAAIELGAK